MIFVIKKDRSVQSIARALTVGDTATDLVFVVPFTGTQMCRLKYNLPNGEEGKALFATADGSLSFNNGDECEGTVYRMPIPTAMTAIPGTVTAQVLLTDSNGRQFASDEFCFLVRGIVALPLVESEQEGSTYEALLQAIAAAYSELLKKVDANVNAAASAEQSAEIAQNALKEIGDEYNRIFGKGGAVQTAIQETKDAITAAEQEALAEIEEKTTDSTLIMQAQNAGAAAGKEAAESITKDLLDEAVQDVNAEISRNSKRITNLEQGLMSDAFETDSSVAHIKSVPNTALPFAAISKVGGMTRRSVNLIPYPYVSESETVKNGVTFTHDGKKIVLNGTSTAAGEFILSYDLALAPGTYTLSCEGASASDATCVINAYSGNTYVQAVANAVNKAVFEVTEDLSAYSLRCVIYIYVAEKVFDNRALRPMLNEGSDVLPHEPYFQGLRDAKITELEIAGANLFDSSKIVNTTYGAVTISGNDVAITGTYYASFALNLKANVTYFLSYVADSSITEGIRLKYSSGSISSGNLTKNRAFTPAEDVKEIYLYCGNGSTGTTVYSNLMISEGSLARGYAPYSKYSYPVPQTIQEIDGYGKGVDTQHYNYIDYEMRQFVKAVKAFAFTGGEDMEEVEVNDTYTRIAGSWVDDALENYPSLCSHFATGNSTARMVNTWEIGTGAARGAFILPIKFFAVETTPAERIASFKELLAQRYDAGDPVTVVYVSEKPAEMIDLSNVLTADNMIAVEGGGKVIAVNEYNAAAPLEIIYQLKTTEEVSE